MRLKELTNEEFNQFVNTYPIKSLYQTPEYAFVMNEQNYDSLFLGLIDDENHVVAASLILIEKLHGFKYAYAPRGFLIDYQNQTLLKTYTEELKRYLGKRDIIAIKIAPQIVKEIHDINHDITTPNQYYPIIFRNLTETGYYHLGYNNYFEALKPRYEAILDLDVPYYLLFKNFQKSFRTKIRSAVRKGVQIYKGKEEELGYLYLHTQKKYPRDLKYFQDCFHFFGKKNNVDFFYAKLNTHAFLLETQKQYEYYEQKSNQINDRIISNSGHNSLHLINQKITLDNQYEQAKKDLVLATNLLRDHPEGIVLASVLMIKHQNEVYMIMDGYDPKYKKFNAKHLLLWKVIEKYAKQGFQKFNFGGVINPTVKDNKYQGLNQFKLSFNSNIYEYAGDFELVTNTALYFIYRNAAPLRSILKK